MSPNKLFRIALLVSFVAHGAVFLKNPVLNFFSSEIKEEKVEVRYLETRQDLKVNLKGPVKTALRRKEKFLKIPPKISIEKNLPLPAAKKENLFKKGINKFLPKASFNKPVFSKPDIISIKKKITFPPIDTTKINNLSYISYYQTVREKIKRCAYRNYTGSQTGEINLSFVISSQGYLQDTLLVNEKSSQSAYLKGIALRSIRDASPFPRFPKELDYPELSFNLTIVFEIE